MLVARRAEFLAGDVISAYGRAPGRLGQDSVGRLSRIGCNAGSERGAGTGAARQKLDAALTGKAAAPQWTKANKAIASKSGADIAPTFLEHGLSVAMGIKCETGASRRMPIRTIKWVGRIPSADDLRSSMPFAGTFALIQGKENPADLCELRGFSRDGGRSKD